MDYNIQFFSKNPYQNLPPGVSAADPSAPWNEPDPWVGQVCKYCNHYHNRIAAVDDARVIGHVCLQDPNYGVWEVTPDQEACEEFDENRWFV